MEKVKGNLFFRHEVTAFRTPQGTGGGIDVSRTVTVGNTLKKREVTYTTRFTSK